MSPSDLQRAATADRFRQQTLPISHHPSSETAMDRIAIRDPAGIIDP
jgi:hypothetical protein